MSKTKKQEDIIFKKFLRKRLLIYIIPNIIFNTLIPYATLRELGPVQLFEGEFNVARFLLPMALLLPFIITFDILKKTILFTEESKAGFVVPEELSKNKFIFKMAGISGMLCFSINVLLMVLIYLNVPEGYGFNGTIISLVIGGMAALLTLFSALWPIKRLKQAIYKSI